ncbi:MAG: response regulator [Candidatus Omnitrophica bacterium]|nr:response regulator [Candidatus Omnitrophota bacterium]
MIPQQTTQRRMLIVDDEARICRVLAEYFSLKGYDVTTVNGGEEALARAETSLPDVVLLDLLMPGMSGLEALTILTRRYPTLPVIIVSAADQQDAAQQTLQLGAKAFLSKPVDFAALSRAVDQCWASS